MGDDRYWLMGEFQLSDKEKMQEMNTLILELLRKTGICRLTTKTVNGRKVPVVETARPNKTGIVKFNYSIYEKKVRKGNYYNTNTGELVTPDRGYSHFGLTMNLIMTVLEAYSESPCYCMNENRLDSVSYPAAIIQELTGKVLKFENRSRAFDTMVYFRQFEQYKGFTYDIDDFPFSYSDGGLKQLVFVLTLDFSTRAPNEDDVNVEPKIRKRFQCLQLMKKKKGFKHEMLEYISQLLDMSLEERTREAERKQPFDFIADASKYLSGAYLVKIYAEAFDLDFFSVWLRIGKPGYWEVVDSNKNDNESKFQDFEFSHRLKRLYQKKYEDDFIGIWEDEGILLSHTMLENIELYKKKYNEIEDDSLANYDTITNFLSCMDDMQQHWNLKRYVDKDLLSELVKHKDDIRYKKAVYVLASLISDEISLFSELTEQQVRNWLLRKVNWNKCADRYWHYVDLLSNKKRRKDLFGF